MEYLLRKEVILVEIIVKSKSFRDDDAFNIFGIEGLSLYENTISISEVSSYRNIYVSIDRNLFNDDLPFLEEVLLKLKDSNVLGIFFYDMAVLSMTKKLGVDIPLIWNQDFLVTNSRTCKFYEKLGISGIVISSLVTVSEILNISKSTNLKVFLNIFGYQLISVSKRKFISCYGTFANKDYDKCNYMSERGVRYPIVENKWGSLIYSNLPLNGIKYIDRFRTSIDGVILSDFLIDEEVFSKVYSIFKGAIKDEDFSCEEEIDDMIASDTYFFDKETIYRVKRND